MLKISPFLPKKDQILLQRDKTSLNIRYSIKNQLKNIYYNHNLSLTSEFFHVKQFSRPLETQKLPKIAHFCQKMTKYDCIRIEQKKVQKAAIRSKIYLRILLLVTTTIHHYFINFSKLKNSKASRDPKIPKNNSFW